MMATTKTKRSDKPRSGKTQKIGEVLEQRFFDGDGFPTKPPADVKRAMNIFLQVTRDAKEIATKKGTAKLKFIEKLREHGITRIMIDGENKFFQLDEKEDVKIKTIPKAQEDGLME